MMNDSCTPVVLDTQHAPDQSLLAVIVDKLTPDNSAQKLELCRAREKTPFAELVQFGNDLNRSQGAAGSDVQLNLTDKGYTVSDTNASGSHRLLFRSSANPAFKVVEESAYKYDKSGTLTEVLEHASSPQFETIRKSTLSAAGWKEEEWNRYGTHFNKLPATTGQAEFLAQADGSVLRVTRTIDTPMGAIPIGRSTVELRTVYDANGQVTTFKRM